MASASIGAVDGPVTGWRWHRMAARGVVVALALCACAGGFVATSHVVAAQAVARDGAELTRLLRAMTMLKLLMAAAATAGAAWRFGSPAGPVRSAVYGVAIAAMWIGPGLIWNMAHLRLGALLLHGGLFATVVMLWRDPAVGERLAEIVARRRATLRLGGS